MVYEQLKLENQLCFPVYAASRLITREYQPLLDQLGITYPQYLVMMVLWQKESMAVNDIARTLILNTNTITPLLKRMEQQGLLQRSRSQQDERKVLISLSEKGRALQHDAAMIPEKLLQRLLVSGLDADRLIQLRDGLNAIIGFLSERDRGSRQP